MYPPSPGLQPVSLVCLTPACRTPQNKPVLYAQLPSLAEVQQRADGIRERGARTLNVEQRLAVAAHLVGAGGRVPFALFGPPGTGKTVTLVECALQVRHPCADTRLPSEC